MSSRARRTPLRPMWKRRAISSCETPAAASSRMAMRFSDCVTWHRRCGRVGPRAYNRVCAQSPRRQVAWILAAPLRYMTDSKGLRRRHMGRVGCRSILVSAADQGVQAQRHGYAVRALAIRWHPALSGHHQRAFPVVVNADSRGDVEVLVKSEVDPRANAPLEDA